MVNFSEMATRTGLGLDVVNTGIMYTFVPYGYTLIMGPHLTKSPSSCFAVYDHWRVFVRPRVSALTLLHYVGIVLGAGHDHLHAGDTTVAQSRVISCRSVHWEEFIC